jgi:HPt (histidine-containing phosphotransfer) domain-containing protein
MNDAFDLSYLKTLMANDDTLVTKFVNIFKSQCPRQLQELKLHLQNQDWPGLSTVAHSMKTQFTYLNATALATQAGDIEMLADEEAVETLPDRIQSFEVACNRLLDAVV